MAVGTDTLVHNTCLKYKGKTVAVLPCGFGPIYPKRNKKLFQEIINSGGLVLTEYEEDSEANYDSFLERNRIVAGLGKGILVVEALHRSGTSVTADYAFKANRKVFSIPGNLESPYSVGTNNLIKNGAYLTTSSMDILEMFPEFLNRKRRTIKFKRNNIKVKDEYQEIYSYLGDEFLSVDDVAVISKKSIREVVNILTLMEIDGLVIFELGRGYKIKTCL